MDKNLSIFYNRKFDRLLNLELNEEVTLEGCNLVVEIDSLFLTLEYICDIDEFTEELQDKLMVPAKVAQKYINDFRGYSFIKELSVEENLPIINEHFAERKEKSKNLFQREAKGIDYNKLQLLMDEFNRVAVNKRVELLNLEQLVKEHLEMVLKFWVLPGKASKIEYIVTILSNVIVLLELYKYFSESANFESTCDRVKELREEILAWKCRSEISVDLEELKEELRDLSERNMVRRMKHENELKREKLEEDINENIEMVLLN